MWAADRRDVDDAPVARLHHARGRTPDRVERAGEVGVDAPSLQLLVGHAHDEPVACDPGVVHEDRDAARTRSRLAENAASTAAGSATSACTATRLAALVLDRRLRLVARRRRRSRSRSRPGGRRARARPRSRGRCPRDPPVTNATRSISARRSRGAPSDRARCAQVMPAPKPEHSTRSPSLHAAVVDRLEQGERDRRRRRVAVALDVDERALRARSRAASRPRR